MLPLWTFGKFEKTYDPVSQAIRTTLTQQSSVLMKGCCQHRCLGTSCSCEVVVQHMMIQELLLPWILLVLAYSMLPLLPWDSFEKTYQQVPHAQAISTTPTHQSLQSYRCNEYHCWLIQCFFVAMRQLWKDLPSVSGHKNHSYPPITPELPWPRISLVLAYSMLPLLPQRLTRCLTLRPSEPLILTNHSRATVAMDITAGLFNASFVSGHQNHSYSPITPELPLPRISPLAYSMLLCCHETALKRLTRCLTLRPSEPLLLTNHSRATVAIDITSAGLFNASLLPWDSFEKTYQVSHSKKAIRTTPTHQSLESYRCHGYH